MWRPAAGVDEPQHLRYADNSTSASTYDAAHGRDSDYHHIAHVLNSSLTSAQFLVHFQMSTALVVSCTREVAGRLRQILEGDSPSALIPFPYYPRTSKLGPPFRSLPLFNALHKM